MSTPAQIGKREYYAALEQAREANAEARKALKRMVSEGGPLIQALINLVVLAMSENDQALNRLEEIGRNTKR